MAVVVLQQPCLRRSGSRSVVVVVVAVIASARLCRAESESDIPQDQRQARRHQRHRGPPVRRRALRPAPLDARTRRGRHPSESGRLFLSITGLF